MTDRITAEQAERIADELAAGRDSERLRGRACVAIRSLAAERDKLREDLRWIESVAGEPSEPHYGQALSAVRDRAHFALGENQP